MPIYYYREGDERSLGEEDKRRSTESLPAKTYHLGAPADDSALDKSASHPNIAIPQSQQMPRTTRLSTASTDSGKSHKSSGSGGSSGGSDSPTGSLHSLTSKDSAYSMSSKETLDDLNEEQEEDVPNLDVDIPHQTVVVESSSGELDTTVGLGQTRSTEELHNDIDSALAEVMSGLQSLEMQQKVDPLPKKKQPPSSLAKHTPDLVLDLPINNEPPSPKDTRVSPPGEGSGGSGGSSSSGNSDTDSPTLSTAEMFAKSNQSTIKKGQSMTMPKSMTSSFTAGSVGPSPLARVQELSQLSSSHMRRSASSNAAMHSRRQNTPPRTEKERYSDPPGDNHQIPEQVWQPQIAQIIKAPSPAMDRPRTPERAQTPEKPVLPSKPGSLPRPSPDRVTKPTPPPIKAKPPTRKKPAVLQKLNEGTLGSMDSSNA